MHPIERVIIAINQEKTESEVCLQEATTGISPVDLGEIMDWAKALFIPSINQLDPLNLVFFMLPSGCAAIGRLVPNFRNRSDSPTQTQCFYLKFMVASPDTLRAFGNNPIYVFQTALNGGQLLYSPRHHLDPIELCLDPKENEHYPDNACWVDETLLKGLAINPGAKVLALLIQSVLDSIVTYFSGSSSPLHLISGLFSLLPVHWRSELCFSVGLQFGGEHYLRIISYHVHYNATFEHDPNLPMLELDRIIKQEDDYELYEGWAEFVYLVLQNDSYSFFQEKILKDYQVRENDGNVSFDDVLKTEEINESGFECLYELQYLLTFVSEKENKPPAQTFPQLETEVSYPNRILPELEYEQPLVIMVGKNVLFSPFQRLYAAFPDHKEDLQQLDAHIARALTDNICSLEILTKYWNEFCRRFGEEELWTIREEYIHYIQELISYEKRIAIESSIQKNIAALEILGLLLN